MGKWIYLLLFATSFVLYAGCSSTRVGSDYVKGTDFTQYQTYAWLPNGDTSSSTILNTDILNSNIRYYVNKEMNERGLTIDVEKPDLLILPHLMVEQKEEYVRRPVYSSYNYFAPGFYAGPWYNYYYLGYQSIPQVVGYDIDKIEYVEGRIVIDIIDRKKNQVVWRGWSQGEKDNPKEMMKDLDKTIDEMFNKFPIK